MKRHHDVRNVVFEGDFMVLTIDDEERRFLLREISASLHNASDRERTAFEISPSGYGIRWSLLDEDISIDGLLGISHAPESQRKSA
jgi:hypothetical protein